MTDARWFAVPANPHQEATAAGSILRHRLSLFFPRYWTAISHSRRFTAELRPLIPGLLFVRPMHAPGHDRGIADDFAWIDSLHRRPGIAALNRADRLLTIPLAHMALFRSAFDEDGVLRRTLPEAMPSRFMPGDHAPITGGPMSGQDIIAEILKVDGKDRVRVLIPLLHRLVETSIPPWFLGNPVSPGPRAGAGNKQLG